MAKTEVTSIVAIIVTFMLPITLVCSTSTADESVGRGISLEAADALHERLHYACSRVGTVALYQGALANRLLRGIPPTSYPGRWDIYPVEKITDHNYNYAPHLATENDRLFYLQITKKKEGEFIELIVQGEKITVSILGVGKEWHFPRSEGTTIKSLLEACSDRSWKEIKQKGKKKVSGGSGTPLAVPG